MPTKIQWTDEVLNVVTGCTKVSSGCQNCYAERFWPRLKTGRPFTEVRCRPDRLGKPMHWRKPRRIFVCSMGDLFHEKVPEFFIESVLNVARMCPQHTFQILTKRPERMVSFSRRYPKNVWIGVSVEDQETADRRLPLLAKIDATVRFASCEPLLGAVILTALGDFAVDWVIVGGESGPKARSMQLEWVRSIKDQCCKHCVPFFFKQWGEWCPLEQCEPLFRPGRTGFEAVQSFGGEHHGVTMVKVGKKHADNLLDGRTWEQVPEIAT